MTPYAEIKKTRRDWLTIAIDEYKQATRLSVLDSSLRRGRRDVLDAKLAKEIEKICEEIDDEDQRINVRDQLTAFNVEVWRQAIVMIGNLTARQFVNAIVAPKTVSERDKEELTNAVKSSPDMARRVEMLPSRGFNRGTAMNTYYPRVHAAIKEGLANYQKITEGKAYIANVNPRNIAEMNARHNDYLEKRKALQERGVKIVFVPGYMNCSRRCRPFQNRFYSLDGTSGTIDGKSYVPIEEASDNVTYTSQTTGRTYYAGLFSYNCNHQMQPYDGQEREDIDNDEVERVYSIQEEQRAMERKYRFLREKYLTYRVLYNRSGNDEMRKTARSAYLNAAKMRKEYEAFSTAHRMPYYPDRLKVVSGEGIYKRTGRDPLAQGIDI